MPDKSPAFQFYPKDLLTDEKVVRMSNTELGIYIRLLCYCWLEGTLPLETEALAHMARMPLKQFTKLWEKSIVRSCFQVNDDGRLHHKRLDKERDGQQSFKRRQSDRGKAGADARWHKDAQAANACAIAQALQPDGGPAMPVDGSSSSSPSPSPSPSPEKKRAPDARSKRPIYQSDRFAVFEWQLTELMALLGPHTDAFDLHGFFDVLSARSRINGLVIPADRDERWKWLQAEVVSEARQRGLPIAQAPAIVQPMGKLSSRMAALVVGARSGV